ncbi:MAG: alpha/beta hydrolase [Romboutsia sp.]
MFIKNRDDINLYVNQIGEGLPCVYIHGGPGAWSKDFENFFGKYMIDKLNMIYIDQRGCGRSGVSLDDDYSIKSIVEDIEEIRVKLKLDKIILLAHSFGGILATVYADKYRDHVKGIILMNCTLDMKASLQNQINKGYELLGLTNKGYGDNLIETWKKIAFNLINDNLYYQLQFKDYNNYLDVENIDREIVNTSMSKQSFDNASYFYDYRYISCNIENPTLIISGNEDYAIGQNHSKTFKFKNSISITMNTKHTPYVEDRSDLIYILEKFISKLT